MRPWILFFNASSENYPDGPHKDRWCVGVLEENEYYNSECIDCGVEHTESFVTLSEAVERLKEKRSGSEARGKPSVRS